MEYKLVVFDESQNVSVILSTGTKEEIEALLTVVYTVNSPAYLNFTVEIR
jgi:hypothetical protein